MSSAPIDASAADTAKRTRRRFTVDSLFVDHRPQAVGVTDLATAKNIQLDRIVPDPDQPRRSLDPKKLEELSASIRREGMLQPVVVRYDVERDVYVLLHGERRWRAARAVGLHSIPAIVRDTPAERRLIQQLMENVVREDLNAVDRAAALRALKTQLNDAPWETVAEAVGIRRSRLFQLLGTEKLPERVREDIRSGRLSEKQSRVLHGLDPEHQEALRVAMVEELLPNEEVARRARALRSARDDAMISSAPNLPADHAVMPVNDDAEPVTTNRDQMMATLLSALTAAGGGGQLERKELAAAAKAADAPPYDAQRLQTEVLALARTLARAPASHLRPGGAAYPVLIALWGALDAILRSDQ